METAKALAKAIKVMQVRLAEIDERVSSAKRDYDAADKSWASPSMLVSYASTISHHEAEYASTHEAITALQVLESAITRS